MIKWVIFVLTAVSTCFIFNSTQHLPLQFMEQGMKEW